MKTLNVKENTFQRALDIQIVQISKQGRYVTTDETINILIDNYILSQTKERPVCHK